jgi:hypothetical protein
MFSKFSEHIYQILKILRESNCSQHFKNLAIETVAVLYQEHLFHDSQFLRYYVCHHLTLLSKKKTGLIL